MTVRLSARWWLAILVAGQLAALHLIHAGHAVGYQHLRLEIASLADLVAWGVLSLQAAAVLASGVRHLPAAARWLRSTLGVAGTLALLIALTALAATVSRSPRQYVAESVVAAGLQLVALGTIVLFARALHVPDGGGIAARLRRLFERSDGDELKPSPLLDPFAVALAAAVAAIAVLLVVFAYDRHPHVPDEVVYLLHARYFAQGRLTLAPPPVPAAFNIDLMYLSPDRWYSPVPPGWPAVLAIGAFFGVPWLVNPILGGVNVLLAHALLTTLYKRRVARLATLLFAASPWSLFLAMSFMTHTVTLTFALLAALGVARARIAKRSRLGLLFAAGCAIGAVSLVRPLEGLAVALLLGLWSLPIRGRFPLAPSVALGMGAIATGALVLPYNAALTGKASVFPINLYVDTYYAPGSNDLGFGPNRGLGWSGLDPFPGHGLRDVIINANLNATTINTEWLGWATGSLILLLFLLARRRLTRPDWWMLAVVAGIAGIHSFYWFSGGPDFGARYWFLVIVPIAALTARGATELATALPDADPAAAHEVRFDRGSGARVALATIALSLASLAVFVPWRAIDKYHDYRAMRADVRRFIHEGLFKNGLVLIRGNRHPDYASAAIYNPLDLRHAGTAPIFAWDVSPAARGAVVAAYPDRPIWFVDGPTVTGEGFRIVAGPLSAAEAARETGRQ